MSRLGSPQAGSRRVAIAKPQNDIYVALLGIALGALVIAVILLAIEMSDYEWSVNPKAQGPAPAVFASNQPTLAVDLPFSDQDGSRLVV